MMCEVPLTTEESIFAAQNHDLVYKFLRENGLSTDEFYDVVIFGFLRSVQRFFREKKLQHYQFATIAWNCMKVDLINHSKAKMRQKHKAMTIRNCRKIKSPFILTNYNISITMYLSYSGG